MKEDIKINFKIWIERENKPLIGAGGAKLIQAIKETGSLQSAIKKIGWSYRYAWGYLKKLEGVLKAPVVITYKGGFKGGGGMKLTSLGEEIIRIYNRFNNYVNDALNNPSLWMAYGIKSKKINYFNGKITKIQLGKNTAEVEVEVPKPHSAVSIITSRSIDNLDISPGEEVNVVVKATEVMLDK
jgi:molybdate transport system regulatory protein